MDMMNCPHCGKQINMTEIQEHKKMMHMNEEQDMKDDMESSNSGEISSGGMDEDMNEEKDEME